MKLFEITNGWIGESTVRCYVWAENEQQAREVFSLRHMTEPKSHALGRYEIEEIRELFDDSSPAFSTVLSDSGWEA